MSEEMNRQEAALNEAALTGVSGGSGAHNNEMERAANILCQSCHGDITRACDGGSKVALREYMLANGKISVHQKCPYSKPRP